MVRFEVEDTEISGVKVVTRTRLSDDRGYLSRLFCEDELSDIGWQGHIAQLNETMTLKQGTVRGLHFQKEPSAEMKLVSCLQGRIFDVAVDLRPDSLTFLQYVSCELDGLNCKSLLIPKGCAHGFQALTDDVRMIYCHSAAYDSTLESGVNVMDDKIGINWPLPPKCLSDKDVQLPNINLQSYGGAI